jgi:hypothetical protein
MPKGVMWRQDDLFQVLGAGGNALALIPLETPHEAGVRVRTGRAGDMHLPPQARSRCRLPADARHRAVRQLGALNTGGCGVTLPSRRFDAVELFDEVHRLRANGIAIVGLAFAAPMLEVLDANPGRWDLSCVQRIGSSGTVWSQDNKQGLLQASAPRRHADGQPRLVGSRRPGRLDLGGRRGSDHRPVPGRPQRGGVQGRRDPGRTGQRRARPGGGRRLHPLGYYKDEEKSAKTFQVFEDRRWSVPGDFAEVNADGTIKLLGRGSQVINTGGEKVFPEEVEEALKTHPAVRDAVVVGVPDKRFGERICAVVDFVGSAGPPTSPNWPPMSAADPRRLQGPARAGAGPGRAGRQRQGRLQGRPHPGARGAGGCRRLGAACQIQRGVARA